MPELLSVGAAGLLRAEAAVRGAAADPPLDPSGDEARSSLRRELVRPEYYDTNLLDRILRWIERAFQDGVESASGLHGVSTFAAIVVGLALALALAALVSRARRTTGTGDEDRRALTDEQVTAAELRARADAAFAQERYDAAVVDGFRALAVRQVERDRIEDLPQATAHELAGLLGGAFPSHRDRIDVVADLFDSVLYGDHPATREQAGAVLVLDDELAGRTVRR